MIKKVLLTVFLVLVQTGVFGATITSTSTGGNWSAASTWTAISRTGTITTTSGSINVSGTGTSFLTELAVGSILKTTGGVIIGTVATITSNTALTLVANATSTYTGIAFTAQVLPTASDDVVISTTGTNSVTIISNAFAKSISVFGILTINNGITLTVYGNVDVASGAKFNAGSGSSDSAIIKVYGDFINNGTADFWKSTVVIAGNLVTASTILQNNGEIIVGGDVSGVIGDKGGGIVYPVNPYAIVVVTGSADEKPPGTLPPTGILLDLTNEVIYGGTCPFIGNTANVSACSGTSAAFSVTFSSSPTTGTPTYLWQVNMNNGSGWVSLTEGASYSGVTNQNLTISGVTATMNNYKYRVKITWNGCTKNGNYGVLTVRAAPATPSVTTTQPNCKTPTGTITVTAPSPAAGITYTVTGTNPVVAAVTNITGVFAGLAPGFYTYSVTNTSGCSSSTSVEIKAFVLVDNIWNGLAWSEGSPPTSDQNIVFAEVTTVSSDLVGCSCQVNADLTVVNGANMILTNGITVSKRSNNTFYDMVFESGSSLVQTNNVSNYGDIKYNRDTQSRNSDYTYWSSPVSSLQTLGGIEGLFPDSLDGTFYSFDSSINPADWKNESSGTSMTVGKGYIARGPEDSGNQTPPNTPFTTTFIGVPNNGTINIPILHSGASDGTSNLIGNPYPSAIDANKFLASNIGVIDGTLYFWTHKTEIGAGTTELGSGLYPYTGADYASYNGTGGAAGSGGKIPNGKIAAGQGFFTTSKLVSGIATFTNTMRLAGTTGTNGSGANEQFFKTKNPNKSSKPIEKNRIWLNLTNTQGAFKQTLVGYVTDATNDYDERFDGESYDGNEFVDFYSLNQDKKLVIQGRALPFDDTDEVPLGFRTTINGAFTINIDQVDGLLTNQAVFLEDKFTNTVFDLKSGNYTFNTVAGTFNNRFVLRYTDNNNSKTLETANFDSLDKTVLVSNKNKQIKIDSSIEMIDKVTVFDLLGRQIYQKANVNSNELSIANLVPSRQMLMVKTVLQNGETVTKKIIY
jgi:hypothetical protein